MAVGVNEKKVKKMERERDCDRGIKRKKGGKRE